MRLARDFGTVGQLLPAGVSSIRDAPWPLVEAIRLAGVFLTFEELEREDRPPRRIWLDMEALTSWFDGVRARRRREVDSGTIEDPVQNEAAKDLIVG